MFDLLDRTYAFLAWKGGPDMDAWTGEELDDTFRCVSRSWWRAASRWR